MDCPDACSLVVTRADDGSVKVKGNPDNPFTSGLRVRKLRITSEGSKSRSDYPPAIENQKGWENHQLDEALDLCAAKIQNLRSRPTAILHIHNEGAKGVLKEATALLFSRLGTSRVRDRFAMRPAILPVCMTLAHGTIMISMT